MIPSPIYLAGPMSGLPEDNRPAFHKAAGEIRRRGHTVISPAEIDEECGGGSDQFEWAELIRRDLPYLAQCESIALLPGWRQSKGATLEAHIAKTLDMPLLRAPSLEPIHESALQEAQRLVHGPRGDDYGHPLDDFTKTAKIWSAILGIHVTPEQVGLCMVGVKISRECNRPQRDNRVDGAGYFETVQMIHEERARRSSE